MINIPCSLVVISQGLSLDIYGKGLTGKFRKQKEVTFIVKLYTVILSAPSSKTT